MEIEPLLADHIRAERSWLLVREELCVLSFERLEFFGQLIDWMNRVGGAHGDTGAAVDASVRVDVELGRGFETRVVFFGMNAIRGTNVNAKEIFDTGVGNYIGHGQFS
jgi:hypothetical protein